MKNLSIKRKLNLAVKGLMTFLLLFSISAIPSLAASHGEAPLISRDPFADNTDTYAFRSYEPGREGFVTLIANYIPFQLPSGAPHYYLWDDTVLYEIKIDNTGDGREDITYQFQFTTQTVNPNTPLGRAAPNENLEISSITDPDYNEVQTYSVTRVDSSTGRQGRVLATGLRVPPPNIGPRATPNYEERLGRAGIMSLPGGGRVFAGHRDEGFYIDLGGIFDFLNLRSGGVNPNAGIHTTQDFNVSSIAIEVPIQELTRSGNVPASSTANDAVIGVWATASRRSTNVINANGTRFNNGPFRQISRLGNPLVNELVLPLRLKDPFNSLSPENDAIAAPFVQDPPIARIISQVFGINVPPPPRNDLVAIYATGIRAGTVPGAPNFTTFLSDGQPHEYLRLNVALPPTAFANINRLGLLGGDAAGFPNGRRPQDDVVDITLRAAAGGTPFTPSFNIIPNNILTDGVNQNDVPFLNRFPYLGVPQMGNFPRSSNLVSP